MVDLRKDISYEALVSKYGESLVNQEIDLELESKELAKEKFCMIFMLRITLQEIS